MITSQSHLWASDTYATELRSQVQVLHGPIFELQILKIERLDAVFYLTRERQVFAFH